MSSFEDFWDEFQERFSRAPVWLPGTPMELGEIGLIDRRGYLRIAHLADYGITYETQPSSVQSEYSVTSSAATMRDIRGGAAAADPTAALGAGQVGMRVAFSGAGGFVVRCKGVTGTRITDVLAVERQILDRNRAEPFWERDWIYVQEVVTAKPCILVVSARSGAEATIHATASAGAASFAQVLDAGAGLTISDQSSIDQYVATPERAPLMWRGRWLRGLLRKKFVSRGALDESELTAGDLYEDFDDPTAFDRDVTGG
jgi:hypothetical protein